MIFGKFPELFRENAYAEFRFQPEFRFGGSTFSLSKLKTLLPNGIDTLCRK